MNRIALKHKKDLRDLLRRKRKRKRKKDEGVRKGFAAASQDSINELNGRFTALQQTASYIQIDTSQISASTKRLTDISAKSLVHLSSIDRKVTNLKHCKI